MRRYLPFALNRRHLKAWAAGVRDGWAQPYDLSSTLNIFHLARNDGEVWWLQESLDAGANLGQLLRSPIHHQRGGS